MPEWYREKEPAYYLTYRAKQLSSKPWTYIFKGAKSRAKKAGWAFDLTDEWAAQRWTGCCEITGLEFKKNSGPGPLPFSPTIDRIDSKKGYTKDNSRFILMGCNGLRGCGTDKDMLEIAKAIVKSYTSIARRH